MKILEDQNRRVGILWRTGNHRPERFHGCQRIDDIIQRRAVSGFEPQINVPSQKLPVLGPAESSHIGQGFVGFKASKPDAGKASSNQFIQTIGKLCHGETFRKGITKCKKPP